MNAYVYLLYYPCARVFAFARSWILPQYFPIIPAATAIDLAVDGDVSSVKLSVPAARSAAPMMHSSEAARVSSLTSGVPAARSRAFAGHLRNVLTLRR